MLFAAFVVGAVVTGMEMRRKGLDHRSVYSVAAVAALAGVAGARFFYVLGHLDFFAGNWGAVWDFRQGGLVYYGGLLFAVPAVILLLRRTGLPLGKVADCVGLSLPLCLAVARVGCFLNGCCGGKPSGLPWAVTFPGSAAPVHPTQLYEMALDIAVFVFLLRVRKRLEADWALFFLSLASYGLVRFVVEFFRYHPDPRAGPFFQALSLLLFVGGLAAARRVTVSARPGKAREDAASPLGGKE
jgi:phosphatidylglycerol:prolipoprotein diacylglycerol transferase